MSCVERVAACTFRVSHIETDPILNLRTIPFVGLRLVSGTSRLLEVWRVELRVASRKDAASAKTESRWEGST